MKKTIILSSLFCSLNLFSQVGINTTSPTATLDVNGNARVRSMTEINTEALAGDYNRRVVANSEGKLGYISGSSTEISWQFGDNKYALLTAPITSSIAGGRVNLSLNVPITIPAKTKAQVVVNYSIPVLHSNSNAGTIGYIGCTLYKSVNGGTDTEIEMGSRKYTVPGSYNGGPTGVEAKGLSISGFAIDIISNTGNIPINVIYKVDGYIEGNNTSTSTISFGMFSAPPANNFNWGRGAMSTQIFTKPIN